MRTLWELFNAGSLAKLQPMIEPYAGGYLRDPLTVGILAAPSWGLLGFFGILSCARPQEEAADRLRTALNGNELPRGRVNHGIRLLAKT